MEYARWLAGVFGLLRLGLVCILIVVVRLPTGGSPVAAMRLLTRLLSRLLNLFLTLLLTWVLTLLLTRIRMWRCQLCGAENGLEMKLFEVQQGFRGACTTPA
jgi:hypothetical protein